MGIKKITLGILGLAAALTLLALFTNADYHIISGGHIHIVGLLFDYLFNIIFLTALASFLILTYGIVRLIVSRKDKPRIKLAKHHVVVGAIGVVVAILGFFILSYLSVIIYYGNGSIPFYAPTN